MKPNKENTLYLPIRQKYFDEIISGKKTKEYREIKDTTYTKYLETWKEGKEKGIYFDDDLITSQEVADSNNDPMIWNNGVYPYDAKEYKYLNLRAGRSKESDNAIIEVKNITFEPAKTKDGKIARFNWTEEEGVIFDESGQLCVWQVVYDLGKIIKKDLKKDR